MFANRARSLAIANIGSSRRATAHVCTNSNRKSGNTPQPPKLGLSHSVWRGDRSTALVTNVRAYCNDVVALCQRTAKRSVASHLFGTHCATNWWREPATNAENGLRFPPVQHEGLNLSRPRCSFSCAFCVWAPVRTIAGARCGRK